MINVSLKHNISCDKVCKSIEKEVNAWKKENGNNLDDCLLSIDIIKITHTVSVPKDQVSIEMKNQLSK